MRVHCVSVCVDGSATMRPSHSAHSRRVVFPDPRKPVRSVMGHCSTSPACTGSPGFCVMSSASFVVGAGVFSGSTVAMRSGGASCDACSSSSSWVATTRCGLFGREEGREVGSRPVRPFLERVRISDHRQTCMSSLSSTSMAVYCPCASLPVPVPAGCCQSSGATAALPWTISNTVPGRHHLRRCNECTSLHARIARCKCSPHPRRPSLP